MKRLESREGFVLPVVIMGLVLLSTMAVAALLTADDERRSSSAMRESGDAFYAAEAGLQEVWGTWPDSAARALDVGDTLDLGWRDLDYGAGSYRARIVRVDGGSAQRFYVLESEGRGAGPRGGQRLLALTVTETMGTGYSLGDCCEATVTVRGNAHLEHSNTWTNGNDEHPPGWEDAGVCADTLVDKPGLLMQDTSLFSKDSNSDTIGNPALDEDPTIDDATFNDFGSQSWADIKDMADHVIGDYTDQVKLDDDDIYPRYNGDGTCDTSHPYNWGSTDPTDPCFDYFPIILVKGEVELTDLYGQGVFILDWDDGTGLGGEFELEENSTLSGLILGRGCVEVQDQASFRGSIFVDGKYYDDKTCGDDGDAVYNMHDGGKSHYSQCAVDRAIFNSGLEEHAQVDDSGLHMIADRAFTEMLR